MNWSFIHPGFLWALPAALLPILLHLLLRRPPRSVVFSDLRLLRRAWKRSRPRKRLEEWLLLLARVLTVLFLVAIFSRPVFHWGGRVGSGESLAAVVLLDASYSMKARQAGVSLFDHARDLAGRFLKSLGESDRAAVVVVSDRVETVSGPLTNPFDGLEPFLETLSCTSRTTQMLEGLRSGYALLAHSGAANKVILVLSDMGRNGWEISDRGSGSPKASWSSLIPSYDPTVRLISLERDSEPENVGILSVRMNPNAYLGELRLLAEVKNFGSKTARTLCGYEVPEPGREGSWKRLAETSVSLAPGELKTVPLNAASAAGEAAVGRVFLRSDALDADDRFYVALPQNRRVKVLCIEEQSGIAALSGESFYLKQALTAAESPFEWTSATWDEAKKIPFSGYSLIILMNPSPKDEEAISKVEDYRRSGGRVLLSAGDRLASALSSGKSLSALGPVLGARLRGVRTASIAGLRINSGIEDPGWAQFQSDYEIQKIRFDKVLEADFPEGAEPWLVLEDGSPLLVLSADHSAAYWLSTLDRSWTNLPAKPLFAPLMRFFAGWLTQASNPSVPGSLQVGQPARHPLPDRGSNVSWEFLDAQGRPLPLKKYGQEIVSAPLESEGLYRWVSRPSGPVEWVAANLNRSRDEGNLAPVDPDHLRALLPGTFTASVRDGTDFLADLKAKLRGKEAGRWFLAVAASLLLAESLWTARRRV